MKKILFSLCGLAAVCLMVSAFAGDKQPASAGSKTDMAQLTQEVVSLEARIKLLEDRLAKLEKDKTIKLVTSPSVINPAPNSKALHGLVADPNRPPNAWGEREFNRLKYYLIPLDAQAN